MRFDVQFNQIDRRLNVTFGEVCDRLDVEFSELQKVAIGDLERYMGDYEITPRVDSQTLPTKEKIMVDDVTINAIPYFEVGNTVGGSTVYIGNEV